MSKESIKQFLKYGSMIVLATVVLAGIAYSIIEFAG
ncbi:hypothetical protein HOT39_gp08 [Escherichia phage LL5]|jgi:hypothetical protein|uniref:Uncharacterized protein n=8 Tax=Tlsvirus TaxID=1920865 RepID=A0AAF0CH27_9CAUD|nr:gp08 [Escherichia phage Tls]YP_009790254.1 hypothetical protein HOR74_gp55 [Citrobacter phage CF1 DK-2017]YP_009802510.1 hypothetical protein HOT39_gp08 [Escherichia phage LL5]QPX73347.1 hypothetical protein SUPREME284_69 [Citrobacter phage vB_CfrD_Supreme284]QRV71211.1 hypothetical protein U136B_011 [Escherichia phage U136B]QXV77446.1 hypothetical protein bas08_0071 [Escherichia phage DanielBernoulli]UGO52128.1 hypothetical protein BROOKSBY_69 [Citrobacter phage vB_CfrD_Brooksby]UUT40943